RNNRPGNCHIKSVRLNGKPYNLYYINHSDIMAGGMLEFDMENEQKPILINNK
ncbi:MAG: glycoside hydrolase family 92 protein, partial [Bacteroidales bacterium]|nr:glycoside hydrolase family 92 protein [Bacteroidales bacterium]